MNPIQTHGILFETLQRLKIFADGKTLVDCELKTDPETIEAEFSALLTEFANKHFAPPNDQTKIPAAQPNLKAHIDSLWALLERKASAPATGSSLLALPEPFIVPGGRFNELYYWDSYFSALGLRLAGRMDLVLGIAKNFSSLIARFGFIPNGSRSYFLTRSQPPFFVCLLELIATDLGLAAIQPFLPSLEREYAFWMQPDRILAPGLHRYWGTPNTPREESYVEDFLLGEAHPELPNFYADRRAGAESGWDFSSRWNGIPTDPSTIRTTQIAPIDLNCLLYQLELKLGQWLGNTDYTKAAQARKKIILERLWDETAGWFFDFNVNGTHTQSWHLGAVFPLFFGIASQQQAEVLAANLEQKFLYGGGLITTLHFGDEQWDAPNGWAPLQWLAVRGLERYGFMELATKIRGRFTSHAEKVWQQTGKLMEKYDVVNLERLAGGGEYPAQDGFGWTNGVLRDFLE